MLKKFKLKKTKIKAYFCLFLIFFNIFILKKIHIINSFNINHYKSSILKYPKLNDIKLNYYDKCGEFFKFKPNNKRDLVMFAYNSINYKYYSERSLLIYNIIDSIKKNIPNVKIVCFVQNNSNIDLIIQLLRKHNVLIIKRKKFLNIELVSSRFLYEYEFLKKNINSYDRIIHADLTDIVFLSDIFRTIKSDELIMNKECGINSYLGKNGTLILNDTSNREWLITSFGNNKTLLNILKQINPVVINAGLIMGDSKEYLKFLTIMIKNFNYIKASNYGYDQILLNVLYYTGELNKINIKLDLCTQRSCLLPKLIFNTKNKELYYNTTGCSPILIHKSYPSN